MLVVLARYHSRVDRVACLAVSLRTVVVHRDRRPVRLKLRVGNADIFAGKYDLVFKCQLSNAVRVRRLDGDGDVLRRSWLLRSMTDLSQLWAKGIRQHGVLPTGVGPGPGNEVFNRAASNTASLLVTRSFSSCTEITLRPATK